MPRDKDRPQRQVEQRRRFLSKRKRLEPERLAAAEVDPASQEPGAAQRRLVSLFEPDQPDPPPTMAVPSAGGGPQPGTPLRAPRPRRAWLLLTPAVTLAVGLLLGFALGSARADGGPTSAKATSSPVTQPAPTPASSVVTRPTASSACLETARRGDQIIHLLVTNRRSRAADLLVAYTVASRQCRRDASP
jgi:hypothetical protein